MRAKLEAMVSDDIKAAYGITEKLARQAAVGAAKGESHGSHRKLRTATLARQGRVERPRKGHRS